MVTYEYDLDVVPRGVPVVVPVKQYEDDAEIVLHAYSRRATLVVPTGSTAFIRGTKPDGNVYSANIELENFGENTVDAIVDVTKQMTAVQGRALFEVVFTYQQAEIITASFVLDVVDAAMDLDAIQSESILRELQDKVDNAYVEDGYLYLTGDGQVIAGPFAISGAGTSDHRSLSHRDADDQHPINAITGLQSALDGKQPIGDYALRSEIPSVDGFATKAYVDSHHDSTKQDVISDLATIRSGAALGATALQESHVFVAEYGVTPFDTIKQQYEKDYVVQIYRQISGRMLVLDIVDVSDTIIRFGNISGGDSYSASVTSSNVWANSTDTFQVTRNRVTSISSASTDAQYPSAKAVYNAISAAITDIDTLIGSGVIA